MTVISKLWNAISSLTEAVHGLAGTVTEADRRLRLQLRLEEAQPEPETSALENGTEEKGKARKRS